MLRGIGTIRASALVAALASSSRVVPLCAWMLGPPQKPGQGYGAKSAARTARKLDQYRGGICSSGSAWLEERVALANKNARILWAMLTKDVRFNADHVSERGQPLAGWRHRGHAIERTKSSRGVQSKMHRRSDRSGI